MVIGRIFKRFIKKGIDFVLKKLPVYHVSIHTLPVYNWFMIQKGNLNYLYKVRIIKYVPDFFTDIIVNMIYQFDYLDLTIIRKRSDLAVLESMAARTQNKSMKFKADVLKHELENLEKKSDNQTVTMDGFIDYIELTFNNIGSIDPFKISTARAFSLYHKAVERNKHMQELSNKMSHVNNSK